jgi:hypothetical protein
LEAPALMRAKPWRLNRLACRTLPHLLLLSPCRQPYQDRSEKPLVILPAECLAWAARRGVRRFHGHAGELFPIPASPAAAHAGHADGGWRRDASWRHGDVVPHARRVRARSPPCPRPYGAEPGDAGLSGLSRSASRRRLCPAAGARDPAAASARRHPRCRPVGRGACRGMGRRPPSTRPADRGIDRAARPPASTAAGACAAHPRLRRRRAAHSARAPSQPEEPPTMKTRSLQAYPISMHPIPRGARRR